MALTAYSIDSCGTTYEYHTTRSQRDRLATPHRSEYSPLRHATTHARRATLEPPCRHISLTDSTFTPPTENRAYRRSISDYTGATHHPYHTTCRLTQRASAPFVVSLRACATLCPAQAPSSYLHTTSLQIRINYSTHKTINL